MTKKKKDKLLHVVRQIRYIDRPALTLVTVLTEVPRLTIHMLYMVKILSRDEKNRGRIFALKV